MSSRPSARRVARCCMLRSLLVMRVCSGRIGLHPERFGERAATSDSSGGWLLRWAIPRGCRRRPPCCGVAAGTSGHKQNAQPATIRSIGWAGVGLGWGVAGSFPCQLLGDGRLRLAEGCGGGGSPGSRRWACIVLMPSTEGERGSARQRGPVTRRPGRPLLLRRPRTDRREHHHVGWLAVGELTVATAEASRRRQHHTGRDVRWVARSDRRRGCDGKASSAPEMSL